MQGLKRPLLFNAVNRHIATNKCLNGACTKIANQLRWVAGFKHLVALGVNNLALLVCYIVVFQKLLTNIEVAVLNLTLGAFNGA